MRIDNKSVDLFLQHPDQYVLKVTQTKNEIVVLAEEKGILTWIKARLFNLFGSYKLSEVNAYLHNLDDDPSTNKLKETVNKITENWNRIHKGSIPSLKITQEKTPKEPLSVFSSDLATSITLPEHDLDESKTDEPAGDPVVISEPQTHIATFVDTDATDESEHPDDTNFAQQEYKEKIKQAADGFSKKGSDLDAVIHELSAYKPEDSEMREMMQAANGALKIYRAIEAQTAIVDKIGQLKPQEMNFLELGETYQQSQIMQRKLQQLLVSVTERIQKLKQPVLTEESDVLLMKLQGLLYKIIDNAGVCEKIEQQVRIKLYENKDVTHFDSLQAQMQKAKSFPELYFQMNILTREVEQVYTQKLPEEVIKLLQTKVQGCLKTLVETAAKISSARRDSLQATIRIMTTSKPTRDFILKESMVLQEYKIGLDHIKEWRNAPLSENLKKLLNAEISKADLAISEAEKIFKEQTDRLDALEKNQPGSTTPGVGGKKHVTVNMTTNGITTTSSNVVNQGDSVTVNVYNESGASRVAQFSNITSLVGFSQGIASSSFITNAIRASQVTYASFFYLSPLFPIFNRILSGGTSQQAAILYVIGGIAAVPYVLNRIIPEKYKEHLPAINLSAQVLYFLYMPSLWNMANHQFKNLSDALSGALSMPTALPITNPLANPIADPAAVQIPVTTISVTPVAPTPLAQPVSPIQIPNINVVADTTPVDAAPPVAAAIPTPPPASTDGSSTGAVLTAVKVSETALEAFYSFFGMGNKVNA